MSKEGRPIENIDAKSAIRKNAELASDWAYREEAIVYITWRSASEMSL
jgi:hypothetical protein